MTNFRILGLSPAPFSHLFGLSDDELAAAGARRYVVDANPGFPDRVEMRDLEVGESAILVNFEHQDAPTPYRSNHAIFVREGATDAYDRTGEVPEVLRRRTLSLRSFDSEGMMLDAELIPGTEFESSIERLFADPRAAYVHAHNAARGCYAARVDRA